MRIATLSQAVPWLDRPTNGLYNVAQAQALTALGHPTELFSIAPSLPKVLAHAGGAARRQLNRKDRYTWNEVPINTVRAPAAFPATVRHRVAPSLPTLTARSFERAVHRRLSAALDRFKPDAILAHGMMPWGTLVSRLASERGIPAAVIEHSQGDVMRIEPGSKLSEFYRSQSARLQTVFTVNSAMSERLEEIGAARVRTIRNGVATLAQRDDEPARQDPGRFVILCAGQYYNRKGHAVLLRAFAGADLADTVLRLVGTPPASIRELIDDLGLAGRVEWLPEMPNQELLIEMARADLFALPSWSESFGLVFMEALGSGTPVLMTSDCGAAEHIRNGRHGWVVPPQDVTAVTIALQAARGASAQRRRLMGDAGRRLVLNGFTWEQNARSIMEGLEGSAPRLRLTDQNHPETLSMRSLVYRRDRMSSQRENSA